MTDKLIKQMSDETLLDQINAYDPYDVEFSRRFWAQKDRIFADAKVIKAAEALAEQCETAFDNVDGGAPAAFYKALDAFKEKRG